MLCLVTDMTLVRSRQMQLQMLWLVGLRERPLGALTFPSLALTFPRLALTFLSLMFLSFTLTFRASLSRFRASLFKSRSHPVGSLHFFDLDPTAPDPRLRNTRPVPGMSMRRVLKRASRRIYKDNISGMKLGCRAMGRRQSGPNNQDQASWIRRLRRLRWGLTL